MQPKGPAIRKRTQIAMANRVMFVWVAGVSILVGFAAVGSIFLVQRLLFNERVISAKSNVISVLKTDIVNVKELESQIRLLETNEALISVKANPDDKAIQVILDALPSEANFSAFGASIQKKLLEVIPGIQILKLQVDPVAGIESLSNLGVVQDVSVSSSSVSQNAISFTITIIIPPTSSLSDAAQAALNVSLMKKVLTNMESSIRTIDVVKLKIEGKNQLTIQGWGFYEPARTIGLKDKTVK